MKKRFFHPEWIIMALTALFCVYGTNFAERIGVNDGGGWDGNGYVYYARELPRLLEEKEVDKYYLTRFLPSVVVRGMMEVSAVVQGVNVADLNKAEIIQLFSIWSAICLLLSVVLLLNAIREYEARIKYGLWILLVGNFFILKMTFFYPTLTDMTAFLLASILLWSYKKKAYTLMLLACVAGYFTHPLLCYTGLLLWLFNTPVQAQTPFVSPRWNWVIAGVGALALLAKLIVVTHHRPEHLREYTPALLPFSIGLATLFVGYLIYRMNPVQKLQALWTGIKIQRLLIVLALWGSLTLLAGHYSSGQPGMDFREFLHYVTYDALTDPLIFLVAHIVYFGPAIILMIFFFPQVCESIEKESLGFQMLCWAGLLLSINSESRQMVIFWPFFVYSLLEVLSTKVLVKKYVLVFLALLSLIWSKCWLTLQPSPYELFNVNHFPEQLYFMHHGPWMMHSMYLLQGSLVIAIAALLYAALKFFPSNTARSNPDSSY